MLGNVTGMYLCMRSRCLGLRGFPGGQVFRAKAGKVPGAGAQDAAGKSAENPVPVSIVRKGT